MGVIGMEYGNVFLMCFTRLKSKAAKTCIRKASRGLFDKFSSFHFCVNFNY